MKLPSSYCSVCRVFVEHARHALRVAREVDERIELVHPAIETREDGIDALLELRHDVHGDAEVGPHLADDVGGNGVDHAP